MSVRCDVCRGTWETVELAERAHAQADVFEACPYHRFTPEFTDDMRDESIARVAGQSGPSVSGMLMWIDPVGGWWIAPLGSSAPSPHEAPSPAWLPIEIRQRADMA